LYDIEVNIRLFVCEVSFSIFPFIWQQKSCCKFRCLV